MHYYYTDSNGSKYAFKEPQTDSMYIPITKEQFEYQEVDPRQHIWDQIYNLKGLLASTDYQAIKFAEGQISAEDYEPIKQQRQAWRNQINQLEAELTQEE